VVEVKGVNGSMFRALRNRMENMGRVKAVCDQCLTFVWFWYDGLTMTSAEAFCSAVERIDHWATCPKWLPSYARGIEDRAPNALARLSVEDCE